MVAELEADMDQDISTRARQLVGMALERGWSSEVLRSHARDCAARLMQTGERAYQREIASSMAAAEVVAQVEARQAAIARRA